MYYIFQNSSTYWEGKVDAETLQRVYGISFPDTKQLKEWKFQQEEAAKRDHRKIGRVGVTNFKTSQKFKPVIVLIIPTLSIVVYKRIFKE